MLTAAGAAYNAIDEIVFRSKNASEDKCRLCESLPIGTLLLLHGLSLTQTHTDFCLGCTCPPQLACLFEQPAKGFINELALAGDIR